jgi:hypothetical protein
MPLWQTGSGNWNTIFIPLLPPLAPPTSLIALNALNALNVNYNIFLLFGRKYDKERQIKHPSDFLNLMVLSAMNMNS